MDIQISTDYAIQQVLLGLDALARSKYISNNDRNTVTRIADKINQAKEISDKIHVINIFKNKIDNIDKHAFYLGSWPHRATVIHNGEHIFFKDEIGGIICQYFCEEAYQNALAAGRVKFMQ